MNRLATDFFCETKMTDTTDFPDYLTEERTFLEATIGNQIYRYLIPKGLDADKMLKEDFLVFKLDTLMLRFYNPKRTWYVERSYHAVLEIEDENAVDCSGLLLKTEKPSLGEDVQEIEEERAAMITEQVQSKDKEIRALRLEWKLEECEGSIANVWCAICMEKEPYGLKEDAKLEKEAYRKKYPLWSILFNGTDAEKEQILRAGGY